MAGALDGSSKGNGIIAVMFFALIFGAALAQVGNAGQPVIKFLEGVFAASMRILDWAMRLAPLGVACLVFAMTSRLGGELLVTLAWFVGTALLGFALQLFVVYPLLLIVVGRRRPAEFFRQISEVMLTAFGTSSSNATLPVSMRVAEERLHLPPAVSRFVLTVGATGNVPPRPERHQRFGFGRLHGRERIGGQLESAAFRSNRQAVLSERPAGPQNFHERVAVDRVMGSRPSSRRWSTRARLKVKRFGRGQITT